MVFFRDVWTPRIATSMDATDSTVTRGTWKIQNQIGNKYNSMSTVYPLHLVNENIIKTAGTTEQFHSGKNKQNE